MKWKKNFGKQIMNERKSWGMSIKRLAKLTHLDEEDLEEIELGININPDFYDMLNICDKLDTSVFFLLEKEAKNV